MKPIFTNSIYAVFKQGSRYIVTLISNTNKVQYSGARDWCIAWCIENDIANNT